MIKIGEAVYFHSTPRGRGRRGRPSKRVEGVVVRKLRTRWAVDTFEGGTWHVPASMLYSWPDADPKKVEKLLDSWRANKVQLDRDRRHIKEEGDARKAEAQGERLDAFAKAIAEGRRFRYFDAKGERHDGVSVVGIDRETGKVRMRSIGKASRIVSVWADSLRILRGDDLPSEPQTTAKTLPEDFDDLPPFLRGRV